MYVASDKLEEEYLPAAMPGRERQLQGISSVLNPAIRGEPAESCWVIGPSGVGKTSSAKFLLAEAEEWCVEYEYVSCVSNTRWEALKKIADAHPSVIAPDNESTDRLRNHIASPDEPFVVILDEIGGLEETELLVDLGEIKWLSLILIGHRRSNALERVPDRVDHLRYADVVKFEPYDDDALFTILDARREVALQHGVVSDSQLERIIVEAGGSARRGVQALRSAVNLAIERGHTGVTEEDIDDCFERANDRIRKQQLESLSRDHHHVYQVIQESGPLCPQRIFEQYAVQADDPSSRQMVVRYRHKLAEYDLIKETEDGWITVDQTLTAPLREVAQA